MHGNFGFHVVGVAAAHVRNIGSVSLVTHTFSSSAVSKREMMAGHYLRLMAGAQPRLLSQFGA